MDAIVLIMFGALISMTTSLSFMELRRIRKRLEAQSKSSAADIKASAARM
jgi:hypothetical protein